MGQICEGEKFTVALAYLAVGDNLPWLSVKLGPKSCMERNVKNHSYSSRRQGNLFTSQVAHSVQSLRPSVSSVQMGLSTGSLYHIRVLIISFCFAHLLPYGRCHFGLRLRIQKTFPLIFSQTKSPVSIPIPSAVLCPSPWLGCRPVWPSLFR